MQIINKLRTMDNGKDILTNKKNAAFLKDLIAVSAVTLVFIVLNFFNSEIKNFVYLISMPVQKNFSYAGHATSGFLNSIVNNSGVIEENKNLKSENEELLSKIVFLETVIRADEAQSQILELYKNSGFNLIASSLIGAGGDGEIILDKGSEDGIEEGMPVVSQQNYLLGKINSVYGNFSKVALISSRNSVINVKVFKNDEENEEDNIYGVVKGDGELSAYLDLIPIDKIINENDVLITSAIDGAFPKNLLVGKVEKVEKNDQNPHQKAKIKLFLDLSLENLFIISNYKR